MTRTSVLTTHILRLVEGCVFHSTLLAFSIRMFNESFNNHSNIVSIVGDSGRIGIDY